MTIMADRRKPHAEDIFSGRLNGNSDSSSNVYKNKRAPAPPSGPLPKIGNYQPKSLLSPSPGGSTAEQIERLDDSRFRSGDLNPKPYIVGDKDTPFQIEHSSFDEHPVAPARRKRRAPTAPRSENPVYGRSLSNISTSETTETGSEGQGGGFDFGIMPSRGHRDGFRHGSENDSSNLSSNGTIEPDYEERGGDIDFGVGIDDISTTGHGEGSNKYPLTPEVLQNGDSEYPFIPPPDYDDEEYTFTFEEEGPQVFKEYAGEDFGKYLQDDEDVTRQERQRRMKPSQGVLSSYASRQQRSPDRKYKKKRKQPKQSEQNGRNTIRDFAFTDTKIGWGDRTVKSTSAKGRYMKREMERNKVDSRAAFARRQSQGPSYEEFLMGKPEMPDSPNSSDSGVDTGEYLPQRNSLRESTAKKEYFPQRNSLRDSTSKGESNEGFIPDIISSSNPEIFYHSQPKQMRNEIINNGHKDSIWKRLTWKFKKSVNITKMSDR